MNEFAMDRMDLFSVEERYLVGVSGGADSVALFCLLVERGFKDLVVCHVDHGLREESGEDARFVEKLAREKGFPCEVKVADVQKRMAEKGESMETAARFARHEFFAECVEKYNCRSVFLAHHADDQAETVLWNLLRGSYGMKGMKGEQKMRVGDVEFYLLRPLLDVRHVELVSWLEKRELSWREDGSNAEAVAVRNRLRNEVFPLLAEISGRDVVLPFVRGAEDEEARQCVERKLLDEANIFDPQGRLYVPALRGLLPVLQRAALKDYLTRQGVGNVSRDLLGRAVGLLDVESAAVVNLPGGGRLRRKEGRIFFVMGQKP